MRKATLFHDRYGGWRVGWCVALGLGVMLVMFFALVVTIVPTVRHQDARVCHRYHDATGRRVKFVRYTFWQWDCLTDNPSQPGTWIPIEQLRGVGD